MAAFFNLEALQNCRKSIYSSIHQERDSGKYQQLIQQSPTDGYQNFQEEIKAFGYFLDFEGDSWLQGQTLQVWSGEQIRYEHNLQPLIIGIKCNCVESVTSFMLNVSSEPISVEVERRAILLALCNPNAGDELIRTVFAESSVNKHFAPVCSECVAFKIGFLLSAYHPHRAEVLFHMLFSFLYEEDQIEYSCLRCLFTAYLMFSDFDPPAVKVLEPFGKRYNLNSNNFLSIFWASIITQNFRHLQAEDYRRWLKSLSKRKRQLSLKSICHMEFSITEILQSIMVTDATETMSRMNETFSQFQLTVESKNFIGKTCVKAGINSVEMLKPLDPYLDRFYLKNDGPLQMHGIVCYNESACGPNIHARPGAEAEAKVMIESLQKNGIRLRPTLKNWTIPTFLRSLEEFCIEVRRKSSLVVICVMSHGNQGNIYGLIDQRCPQRIACEINDVLSIVGRHIPDEVPKLIIIQACQGRETGMMGGVRSISLDVASGSERALTLRTGSQMYAATPNHFAISAVECRTLDTVPSRSLDARRGEPVDVTAPRHILLKVPNVAIMMSTRQGDGSHRNHFIPAMAEALKPPEKDLGRSFGEMIVNEIVNACRPKTRVEIYEIFTKASHIMRNHAMPDYQWQNPRFDSTLRKKLYLPRHTNK